MGTVVHFPQHHARAASGSGNRSGRNSLRETPVSRSIGSTYSAETPRFDFVSQYQIWPCLQPIRLASPFWPPARSQASFNASAGIMESPYPHLGTFQLKTLSGTANLDFGKFTGMVDTSPQGVGNRIRRRREKLGLSQPKLAKILKVPQQTIGGWETGKANRPTRLLEAAKVLCTTQEWLLREEGPEEIVPDLGRQFAALVDSLDQRLIPAALEFLRNLEPPETIGSAHPSRTKKRARS